jgi:hypothetical protein
MPRDVFFVEKGDGVADRDGGAGRAGGLPVRMSERHEILTEPAAFDETDDGVRIGSQDRRATLAERHRMAEEKNFRRRSGLIELGGFERQHFARGAVLNGLLKTLRILQAGGMERERENRLAGGGRMDGQRQKTDAEVAGEGIGRDVQDGHVMCGVRGNNGDREKLRRAIGAADDDARLAAIAKSLQDVGRSEQVALVVYKESVAKKRVMVSARGRRLVETVNDGAERGRKSVVRGSIVSPR